MTHPINGLAGTLPIIMGKSKAVSMTLRSGFWSIEVQLLIRSFWYVYDVVKKMT
jgi:hypothetical protein